MNNDLFIKRIYAKKSLMKLEKKITLLGITNKINVYKYLNYKLLLLLIVFITIIVISKIGYILAPILVVVLYFGYDYIFLDIKIKKRSNIMEHEAIFFFEVFSLTMHSNTNLKLCLENTCNAIDSDLSTEFKYALKEMKLGKSMTEALENLRTRIPSKTVNNVIFSLIESSIYGHSIIDAINSQVVYITDKRILDIKSQINKMPTKISIISVLLFIPLIMILILGPIIISYFVK